MQHMFCGCRFDREPPSRHLAQAANSSTYAKRSFPTELNSYQAKWFITGWNESKLCSTEDIRRERGEFWFRKYSLGIFLHHFAEFQGGELSVQVDDWADA